MMCCQVFLNYYPTDIHGNIILSYYTVHVIYIFLVVQVFVAQKYKPGLPWIHAYRI